MNPDLPQTPTDPAFTALVNRLTQFYKTELPEDGTGITVKRHAEDAARDILLESLGMVERFAQNRSSLAKYDLLKWIGNKKSEVRFYQ